MAFQKHPHRGTGKVRVVYVKDSTVIIEGEVKIDERGKIKSVFGMAVLSPDENDGRALARQSYDTDIALEFDCKKQKFFYFVDEDGATFNDWGYRAHKKYQDILKGMKVD